MTRSEAQLMPGTLEMLILQTLESGPMYGYGIAKTIRTRSDNVLGVEQGSLYPALLRMERKGWVRSRWGTSESGRQVKFYRLTGAGRRELELRQSTWSTFVQAVGQVMGGR